MNWKLCTVLITISFYGFAFCLEETDFKKWDYLTFNQNWLPALCTNPDKQSCSIPDNLTTWTIHGLWPDVFSTSTNVLDPAPFFCNNTWHFNVTQVMPIIDELELKWPSDSESFKSFWKHEWEKHGTCAAEISDLDSILKYFAAGLKLNEKYELTDVLTKSGVTPNPTKEIMVTFMEKVFEDAFGKKVLLQCTFLKGALAPLLSAVEICIDKNLSIIDCPKDKKSNCANNTLIYLPFPSNYNDKIEL